MAAKNQTIRRAASRRSAASLSECPPSLDALELKLDEIHGEAGNLEHLWQRLQSHKRGCEAYLELLPDLLTSLCVIQAKCGSGIEQIEAIQEAMPEDE